MPPLDEKGAKIKTDQASIAKAMGMLQKFFDEFQRDKMLRATDISVMFLSLTGDRNQFEHKSKQISKLPAPKTVSEIKHFGGKAKVELTQEAVTLSNNVLGFVPAAQSLYERMIRAMGDTGKVFSLLSDIMNRNAALFKESAVAHEKIDVRDFAGGDITGSAERLRTCSTRCGRCRRTLRRCTRNMRC